MCFTLLEFFILLIIFILSACNVDGADGDGTTQGTCSDAGQKCKADGTCGAYYYPYYLWKYESCLITLYIVIIFFALFDFSFNFGILIISACNVDGSAGDGTTQGTCTAQDQKCNADGTCCTYYYRY